MENKKNFITDLLNGISSFFVLIGLFLFITGGQFKIYFICFLLGGGLYLLSAELKYLIFNKKQNKKITYWGILLIAITTILFAYCIINTIQL